MFHLDNRELTGLYLFLKQHEASLDPDIQQLLTRLEEYVYQHLSIGEIEELPRLYAEKIDVITQKE